jgi:hypothetical protein
VHTTVFAKSAHPKKRKKLLLHNRKINFSEYDSTKAVNAHAVASIIMFNILSKNENSLNGSGMHILKECTFPFSQYLEYYNSLSYCIHGQKDTEIIKEIIIHFEGQIVKKLFSISVNVKIHLT